MPSLPPLSLANAFQLLLHFQDLTDARVKFRDEFVIHQSVGVPQPADPIIVALSAWSAQQKLNATALVEVELRNWTQGPVIFSQRGAIWRETVNLVGSKQVTYGGMGNFIGGEVVAYIRLDTTGGSKTGKKFLRALLDFDDVGNIEPGGPWVERGTARVTAITFHNSFSGPPGTDLHPYIGVGKDPGLIIVHVGNHHAGPAFSTPVVDMEYAAVTTNKITRKNRR